MKDSNAPSPLGSLLKGFLKRHPSFSASPLGDWRDLVGEQVARYSQPVSLKKKVLVVLAYDSIWKHHLELNKEVLLEKINERAPEPMVEKIVIHVGELPEGLPVLNPAHLQLEKLSATRFRQKRKKKSSLRQLTPEEKELIQSLPDPDLRVVGTRLLRRTDREGP
ncbi:MAG: DUF721 domain-containing protein [Deltaproteobacteria bacterium]|nr:DUF721 domain-containing protein [Deltaproteobacteria bacterium]